MRVKPTPIRYSYDSMLARCYCKGSDNYRSYGERGIVVCARWRGRGGFRRFREDMGARQDGLTLDRIDPNGNYEPDNCRWATATQQARNRRDSNNVLTPSGEMNIW